MMTRQIAETLVNDHRAALLRDATTFRLRRRAAGVVVRTSAPAARFVDRSQRHSDDGPAARHARPSHTAHA